MTFRNALLEFLQGLQGTGQQQVESSIPPFVRPTDVDATARKREAAGDFVLMPPTPERKPELPPLWNAKYNWSKGGVDWPTIDALEGGLQTKGYVPDPKNSQSGVTIGTGIDLGVRSVQDLENLGLSESLRQKLKPYLGLKKQKAKNYLDKNPLKLTKGEAETLTRKVKEEAFKSIREKYGEEEFDSLTPQQKTVLTSVGFQYGSNLEDRTPDFWRYYKAKDWKKVVEELRDFGDRYPTRRRKEADILSN